MTKIIKLYKKDTIVSTILLLCVISIFYFLLNPTKSELVSLSTGDSDVIPYGTLENNKVYSQKFKCNVYDFNSIKIKFSTFENDNTSGLLHIKLIGPHHKVIYDKDVKLSTIKDNDIYIIDFKKISNSKGKEFEIQLYYSEYSDDNVLTFWISPAERNELQIDGNAIGYNLSFSMNGTSHSYVNLWYPCIIICIVLLISCAKEVDNHEKK